MAAIYEQYSTAFARVEAFIVLHKGERVATVAFKFPRDGAGRLYAYVHWLGSDMVRGFAAGGGYDKRSAACSSAVHATRTAWGHRANTGPWADFCQAMHLNAGASWESMLRNAGFTVMQAI